MGEDRGSPARIREMTRTDLDPVVVVHRAAFPDSALSVLGPPFVRAYYAWQFDGPHELAAFVAERDEIVGYVVAGTFDGALGGFLRTNLVPLGWYTVTHPRLLLNERVRRGIGAGARSLGRQVAHRASRVRTRGTASSPPATVGEAPARRFGVLSIAVAPAEQGSGTAAALLAHAQERAGARGFDQMTLTVDPGNARAVRFYEREGWYRVADDGPWSGTMAKALGEMP